ncbi:MAG: hypothetical protein ACAI43_06140 [Phycisphaerae bacterium]|nr:hypothetical protein [Tepidisphaeraceae bacterium]
MAGKVECACGKQYTWKPELAGKRARCKACGGVVSFPAEDPAAVPAGDDPFAVDDVPPPPPPVRAAPARRSAAAPPPPPPERFEDTYTETAPPPPPPPPVRAAHGAPVPISGAKPVGESGTGGGGFSWGVVVNMLIGIGLIGFAFFEYKVIADAEAHGQEPRFGRRSGLTRLVYGIAGKWGVVGVFAGIGLLMLLGGLAVLLGKKKAPAAEDE